MKAFFTRIFPVCRKVMKFPSLFFMIMIMMISLCIGSRHRIGKKIVQVFDTRRTWADASVQCRNANGTLLKDDSAASHNFLKNRGAFILHVIEQKRSFQLVLDGCTQILKRTNLLCSCIVDQWKGAIPVEIRRWFCYRWEAIRNHLSLQ